MFSTLMFALFSIPIINDHESKLQIPAKYSQIFPGAQFADPSWLAAPRDSAPQAPLHPRGSKSLGISELHPQEI